MINKIKIIYGGSDTSFEYTINEKKGTYQGNVNNENKPDGNGIWKSNSDKDYYAGDWNEGKFTDGEGKLTLANGDYYDGLFENENFKSGKVKHTYDNRSIYEGEFKDNKNHGQGKYTFSDGRIYEGGWELNEYNGKGKLTLANGDYYDGLFENDKFKSGKVKLTLANGNFYEGEWQNNKKHGQGKFTKTNGDYEDGEWNEGMFIKGKVKYTNIDGDIYEGGWENNKMHGKGKFIRKNILISDGEYKDDFGIESKVIFFNLPLEMELKNLDKEDKTVTLFINKNEFEVKFSTTEDNESIDKILSINNDEKIANNLKEYFKNLFVKYDSIKMVSSMNKILEYYKKSKIPNIYKFHGLPISFESKMNLLLSKNFNLYITNLLNA